MLVHTCTEYILFNMQALGEDPNRGSVSTIESQWTGDRKQRVGFGVELFGVAGVVDVAPSCGHKLLGVQDLCVLNADSPMLRADLANGKYL